jgi:uracil-DNA glycosylase
MNVQIEETWKEQLQNEFAKPYFKNLSEFVKHEYKTNSIYPAGKFIFNAFNLCPFDKIKVVIIGQDPYHGPNQAHGLCFSVQDGVKFPPSLRNVFKEINLDIGTPMPESGNLTRWAEQGVFLLNATLTVKAHEAGSHQKKGWEEFTHEVIRTIASKKKNVVYLLWGAFAQKKAELINHSENLVLKSVHPSPLSASRGFFGNHHFSKTNAYLLKNNKVPIRW